MLKNYTPHTITIRRPDGTDLELPSLGQIRATVSTRQNDPVDGVPVSRVQYEGLDGVPDNLAEGDYLIVSMVARDTAFETLHPLWERMLSPDSGPTAIRNDKGQIVAVKGLLAA